MPDLDTILMPELAEFGRTLLDNGFKVFVFKSDVARVANGGREACATTLGFTRIVDGQECAASVSITNIFVGPTFSMPIRPTRENGSSMWIGHQPTMNEFDDLTVENAELYASPTGFNPLVRTQDNFPHYADLFEELTK